MMRLICLFLTMDYHGDLLGSTIFTNLELVLAEDGQLINGVTPVVKILSPNDQLLGGVT